MSVEAIRGCGYRKVGGLYLCGEGAGMECDRLPYELKVCPVCGAGVKFSRGFAWLDWGKYAGGHYNGCSCFGPPNPIICTVCWPETNNQPYGLLWVGQDYTPETFIKEALQMGVSKRIAAIPRNLKLDETWVLFATKSACGERKGEDNRTVGIPGVFYAFKPQRLELLVWKSEFTYEKATELEKKHITPILIPDGDVEHDPRTGLKPTDSDKNAIFFDNLRKQLGGMRERIQGAE